MQLRTLVKRLETEHPEGMTRGELFLANEDLLPVEEKKKTWTHLSFVAFWIADCFNLNTFTIAGSMIMSGLTWWQAFICVIIGYTLVGPLVVLNARPGAVHGLTFPAVNRTTFGIFGSLWPVINRAGMACIWWGVQAWLGGECVYIVLRAIWPSTINIPNIMSPASETTSAYILSFCIYWILSLPTIWVPIHRLKWLFYAKAIVGPAVGFALFGWTIRRAGASNVFSNRADQIPISDSGKVPQVLSGSALGWAMLRAISSTFNNMFTLIVNSPDFASRSKTPGAAVWPQLIALPVGFTITSFIGIGICRASGFILGEQYWDVLKIMDNLLVHDGTASHTTRAGVAIIGLGFVYVQLLMNVAANSISAGCDLTALFPRFINIRRGGYVAAIIGICMNPWTLFTSSSTFTTYLGAYGVLLSCIAGPMIADYWLVRRGHYRIADLYTLRRDGWYWYTFGVNWRAYAAYLAGFAINAPGFIHTVNEKIQVSVGMQRVYYLSWITGTGVSALIYVLCCFIAPPAGMNRYFMDVDESEYFTEYVGEESLHQTDSCEYIDDKPTTDMMAF